MAEFDLARRIGPVIDRIEKVFGKINPLWAAGAALTIAIAGGGFLLVRSIENLQQRIDGLRAEVRTLREQVASTSTATSEISTRQSSIQASLTRIEDRVGVARAALELTEDQRRTILTFFNLPSGIAGPPKWKVGDLVPEALLKQAPDVLLKLLPALNGTKYAFDLNGYIVITDAFHNRVMAVVPLG
jgi:hypothetical protein